MGNLQVGLAAEPADGERDCSEWETAVFSCPVWLHRQGPLDEWDGSCRLSCGQLRVGVGNRGQLRATVRLMTSTPLPLQWDICKCAGRFVAEGDSARLDYGWAVINLTVAAEMAEFPWTWSKCRGNGPVTVDVVYSYVRLGARPSTSFRRRTRASR